MGETLASECNFTSRAFTEPTELTSHLRGMAARSVPLRPGKFMGTVSTIGFGDLTLQVIRGPPVMLLGRPIEGRCGFMLALEGAEDARWNGKAIGNNQIALSGGRRRHEAVYTRAFACAFVTSAAAGPEGALSLPAGLSAPDGGPQAVVGVGPDEHASLAGIALGAEQAVGTATRVLSDKSMRDSLGAAILEAAQAVLTSADVGARGRRHSVLARQRIVHAADDYLCANPARPVYTAELCSALAVSPTRLHQAFGQTFGISPHRYLKMRRMCMVRAGLLSGFGPWHSVKSIALAHGFWHLGQFAHDYRALYGESPSATIARASPCKTDAGNGDGRGARMV
jgi:AraC family transcriptional regulator, ethanolamine operon transcriptional activator